MPTCFSIQASNPRALSSFQAEDEGLVDAIQTVFPLESEFAFIIWNWVYVPVSYKYDFSLMIEDVINLLEAMMAASNGELAISWASNTFSATWKVSWEQETTVAATWDSTLGDTASLLRERSSLTVPTQDFIAEWKRPLELVGNALVTAGYKARELPGLERLVRVSQRIPRYGVLYSG